MPVPNPDHLLDQADRLITSQGRGAPRQADLRRAISTAYYSVFHAIVTNATDDLVGSTQRQTTAWPREKGLAGLGLNGDVGVNGHELLANRLRGGWAGERQRA